MILSRVVSFRRRHTAPARTRRRDRARVRRRRVRERHGYVMGDAAIDRYGRVDTTRVGCGSDAFGVANGVRGRDGVRDDDDD